MILDTKKIALAEATSLSEISMLDNTIPHTPYKHNSVTNSQSGINIPTELKMLDNWVVAGADKKPCQAKAPYKMAKTDDSKTWASYEDAQKALKTNPTRFVALGFVLTDTDYVCVDIDRVGKVKGEPDSGEEAPYAQTVLGMFPGTYIERSLSKRGYHVFIRAQKGPKEHSKSYTYPEVELYGNGGKGHYILMTGDIVEGSTNEIKPMQAELDAFIAIQESKLSTGKQSPITSTQLQPSPALSDEQVLDIIRGSVQCFDFEALYTNEGTKADASANDQSMANILAFYTQDVEQIRRIMEGSALNRDKWDREDYFTGTIKTAIRGLTNTYQPNYRSEQTNKEYPFSEKYLIRNKNGVVTSINTLALAETVLAQEDLIFAAPKEGGDPNQAYRYDGTKYAITSDMGLCNMVIGGYIPGEASSKFGARNVQADTVNNMRVRAYQSGRVKLAEVIDRYQGVVHFRNGWYDVKTQTLSDHTNEILSTTTLDFDYPEDEAATPHIDNFLDTTMESDSERIEFVKDLVACVAAGVRIADMKILPVFKGPGNSGKSTLTNLLVACSAGQSATADITKLDDDTCVAALKGARLVVFNEAPGIRLNSKVSTRVRELFGKEAAITVRPIYKQPESFLAPNAGVVVTNHDLRFVDDGEGTPIANRLKIIPFGGAIKNIIDEFFDNYMLPEVPHFVKRCLVEWSARVAQGQPKLRIPSICVATREAQIINNDCVLKFFTHFTLKHGGKKQDSIKKSDFYRLFVTWHSEGQIGGKPLEKGKFNEKVEQWHKDNKMPAPFEKHGSEVCPYIHTCSADILDMMHGQVRHVMSIPESKITD